ncbi:MAG TPA: maleylacetoacetate isomerase [Burkholderiaceae bacterium]|nr:maleylacetoacetate isomerase [Burkholderiaceae bacterium]
MLKLYTYFRSSASFRVRIALAFKGLGYEAVPIHLTRHGGEQSGEAFRGVNPAGLVPVLEDDGALITQSLAIIEYLEEKHPRPSLLPLDAVERAYVRSLALSIACEIHPLDNLRVLRYLVRDLGVPEDAKNRWYRHWVEQGLGQLEQQVAGSGRAGRFALGDQVTLAEVFLVPQIFNARRFECRLDHVPVLTRIADAAMQLPAFIAAQPDRQPDRE